MHELFVKIYFEVHWNGSRGFDFLCMMVIIQMKFVHKVSDCSPNYFKYWNTSIIHTIHSSMNHDVLALHIRAIVLL